MRRYGIMAAFTAVLLALVASPVGAGLQWCPRDPVIALDGQEVQIWVAIPEQYQTAVTGPVRVDVHTPRGVEQEVMFTDEGFNGFGEDVSFLERGRMRGDEMPVQVRVRVPYDRFAVENGDLAVRVTIVLPDGSTLETESARGTAQVDFTLPLQP